MFNLLASYYGDVGCAIGGIYTAILLVAVIVSLTIAFVTAKIASNKGYSYGGFWALGFVLGLLGLIIAACLTDRNVQNYYEFNQGQWKCSHCGQVNSRYMYICSKCKTPKNY